MYVSLILVEAAVAELFPSSELKRILFWKMKQDLIDHINYLARDIPPGAVNSRRLEDDVIDLYNRFINEKNEHEIVLEHACYIATKTRIETYIENKTSVNEHQRQSKVIQPRNVTHFHKRRSPGPGLFIEALTLT